MIISVVLAFERVSLSSSNSQNSSQALSGLAKAQERDRNQTLSSFKIFSGALFSQLQFSAMNVAIVILTD